MASKTGVVPCLIKPTSDGKEDKQTVIQTHRNTHTSVQVGEEVSGVPE